MAGERIPCAVETYTFCAQDVYVSHSKRIRFLLKTSTPEGQQKVLFRRLLELLSTRRIKHQLIETYAQELFVSANYLTKVCRKISGKTAMQWVREYTEADIRYHLLNTDRSITEICDDLGFPNLSFFGKYCRRAFGMSPTEFRKRMGASRT